MERERMGIISDLASGSPAHYQRTELYRFWSLAWVFSFATAIDEAVVMG